MNHSKFNFVRVSVVLIGTVIYLPAQTTVLWSSAGGTAWLTGSNWTGSAVPGTGDIAQFGTNPTGASSVGINFNGSTNNGATNQAIGAIEISSARTTGALTINNSSSAIDGTLTLNGTTVNGISHVVLRNNGAASITLSDGTTKRMDVALANVTDNVITIDSTGSIAISSIITGSAKNLTLDGAGSGLLTLSGANTYSGVTTIKSRTLSVSSLANGGASSNLGASSNAASNLVINGGTLKYTGGAVATDRLFTVGTTGATLDSSGSGTLTLSNTGSLVLSGTNTARTLTLSGSGAGSLAAAIGDNGSGATSVTKSGAGAWTLSGTNTYTGTTTLSAGTLNLNSASSIGTGLLTISAGIIDNTSGSALTLSTNNAQNWNADFTFTGSNSLNLGTGAVTLSANRAITVSANTLTVGGTISGSFNLSKTGAGTLSLTGSNTYTGTTTITLGTLSVSSVANASSASGLGAPSSTSGTLLVINGGTFKYTGAAGSTDRLFTVGLNGATVEASGTGALAFSNTNDLLFGSGTGARSLILSGTNTDSNTLASRITDKSVTELTSVSKAGTGKWVLSRANTYTGVTTINGGTLAVSSLANGSSSSNLGSSTNVATNLVINGGTLQYTGAAVTTDRLFSIGSSGGTLDASGSGALTLSNSGSMGFNSQTGTRTLGLTGTGTGSLAAVIVDNTGATSVAKSGAGSWSLSGNNTYSGGTSITAGTISALHNNALGSGPVSASSGGTLSVTSNVTIPNNIVVNGTLTGSSSSSAFSGTISGTGTLGGTLSIASGGSISPGSSPGLLTVATGGAVIYSSGSTYVWELGSLVANGSGTAGTHWDLISLAGTAALTTNSVFLVPHFLAANSAPNATTPDSFWNSSHSWTVVSGSGSATIAGTFQVNNGSYSNGAFATALAGNDLLLTWTASAIPEPATYAVIAGAAALAGAIWHRRRRRKDDGALP